MNTNKKSKQLSIHREEGAALITALLVSTLLLAAGGALILTTSLTTTTAVDSTAETQAYYAAEAGINTAVNVLRGNSPTVATFRNVADNPNMNQWLTYTSYDSKNVVVVNANPTLGYDILITDPDSTDAGDVPRRLLINVTGYGPKGSKKQLEMLVDRHTFDYSPLATILMRGNDDNATPIAPFTIGESNAKIYSGFDNDDPTDPTKSIPVFGTTNGIDLSGVTTHVNESKPNTVTGTDKVAEFSNSDLPSFLQTADNVRAFLKIMQDTAVSNGRYFTSAPASFGTSANPQLTFIDGDVDLPGGAGLLIVTGKLTMKGNPSFDGLILVLGKGEMERDGGGSGFIYGGIVIASFERTWPIEDNNKPHPFLSPTYTTNGGGNSTVGFDSAEIDRALSIAGLRTLGIREH